VQSVGPKMALAVLSGGSPRELVGALAAGDVKRLTAVPGIGKRTAERIIVELREKVGVGDVELPAGDITVRRADDPRSLALAGLIELGFSAEEAERLLAAAEGDTPEDLLQQALRAARS
jgi:Holliday junction DNA helicase RuvA